MISTDDAEYPREFRTLGSGGAVRRFSSAGLVHTSEQLQSLEALSSLPRRESFLPPHHQGSPAGGMRGQQDRVREQVPDYHTEGGVPLQKLFTIIAN
ncbi:UNVERIFIED_CONTAM: hypothetical protein FKN15_076088 [Acipenser sinensis]